ncbi:MAG: hypothetical protein JWO15_1849 [Sphingomonadales bacterium]|nr:hypothetical protein [Sphingomonadales bacterium]
MTDCDTRWPQTASTSASDLLARRATLFHIGLVVADVTSAKDLLSANEGIGWKDAGPRTFDLMLEGVSRTITLHIAHSTGATPRIELIEAVPDSIWATPHETRAHHHCYWTEDGDGLCREIESAGGERLLGIVGDESGYFRLPDASIIEIVGAGTYRRLTAWIDG